MAKIKIAQNESLDKALRRFKRMCNNEGIFSELKRNSFYDKPSERRRRKEKQRMKAIRRAQSGKKKRRRPPTP